VDHDAGAAQGCKQSEVGGEPSREENSGVGAAPLRNRVFEFMVDRTRSDNEA
jgi:hypothetical protein